MLDDGTQGMTLEVALWPLCMHTYVHVYLHSHSHMCVHSGTHTHLHQITRAPAMSVQINTGRSQKLSSLHFRYQVSFLHPLIPSTFLPQGTGSLTDLHVFPQITRGWDGKMTQVPALILRSNFGCLSQVLGEVRVKGENGAGVVIP